MKRTILFIAAVSLLFTSAEAKVKKLDKTVVQAPVMVLTNEVDSMSYALGMNIGAKYAKDLKVIPGGKSNMELFIKGFNTAIKGDSTLLKLEPSVEYLNKYFAKAQAKDTEAKIADGANFLIQNKTKEGVVTTASGLQYQVLVAKDGTKPLAVDTVEVNYQGFFIDGTKFDSSIDRGKSVSFPLNQVIPGWTEGVQLMTAGSKYKFFVPYTLGYGEKGVGNGAIPGYSTLIFEVELLNIKPFKETPKIEVQPVEKAKTTKIVKKTTSTKRSKK